MCLKLENFRRTNCKSYFWENWVQNKCFWKAFHLILMHFIHKILCFEEFLQKNALFFKKKLVFLEFRSIEPISRPIEIGIKFLVSLCLFRSMLDWCWISRSIFDKSIEPIFRSIESRIESFLKSLVFTWSNTISKHFLSYSIGQGFQSSFLSFSLQFFAKVFVI